MEVIDLMVFFLFYLSKIAIILIGFGVESFCFFVLV